MSKDKIGKLILMVITYPLLIGVAGWNAAGKYLEVSSDVETGEWPNWWKGLKAYKHEFVDTHKRVYHKFMKVNLDDID